jgi:hypothetical protein
MATRTPQGPARKPGESCTEFQMHKSQLSLLSRRNIFDYTEFRLRRYVLQLKDEQQRLTLTKILKDYIQGLVAVAWKSGKPVWLPVTKG